MEGYARQSIAKDKSINILPADKGRTTVVMDTEQCKKQMENILEDANTYEAIKKDPTEVLKPLPHEEKIYIYNKLVPTANITPRIYGKPKKHKTGTPLRPIVPSILV